MSAGGRLGSVLYLEDDEDVRSLITELLMDAGYDVTAVARPEQALAELPRRPDVLLTDYRLPGHNADWLLREARARGLLQGVAVVVLSSERNPPGIEGLPFLQKPVEVDVLLSSLARARLDMSGPAPEAHDDPPAGPPQASDGVVTLRLYVSGSISSLKAELRVRELIESALLPDRIKRALQLVVYDVTRPDDEMLAAVEEDRVVVTPTLVRRSPQGRVAMLGDLSRGLSERRMAELLNVAHT